MVKSIAGVNQRAGSTITIGDNRYGLREAYDPEVKRKTEKFYRDGDKVTVKELKNPITGTVKTKKP